MQKKYKSFTLLEVLVVLAFVSFIIIHEVIIIQQKINNYGALYYNVYNSLRKVSYNIFVDTNAPNGERRNFPKTSKGFCYRLAEWFNIPGNKNYCAEAKWVNEDASNLIVKYENGKETSETLAFKTANGTSFYIGGKYTYNFQNDGKADSIDYFMVYADINGEKKPNIIKTESELKWDNKEQILPDIVPFAVTTTGVVIPMGYPTYRLEYLTAKIKFPVREDDIEIDGESEYLTLTSESDSEDFVEDAICAKGDSDCRNAKQAEEYNSISTEEDESSFSKTTKEYFSKAMTFNEAIHTAWNGREDKEIPFSLLISEKDSEGFGKDNLAKKFYEGKVPVGKSETKYKIKGNSYKFNGYQYVFEKDKCCKVVKCDSDEAGCDTTTNKMTVCDDVVYDCKVIIEGTDKTR